MCYNVLKSERRLYELESFGIDGVIFVPYFIDLAWVGVSLIAIFLIVGSGVMLVYRGFNE